MYISTLTGDGNYAGRHERRKLDADLLGWCAPKTPPETKILSVINMVH
jgi:hypothetical protein